MNIKKNKKRKIKEMTKRITNRKLFEYTFNKL